MTTLVAIKRKETVQKIAIMQAYLDGHRIEAALKGVDAWEEMHYPSWDWVHIDYRIKSDGS